MVKLLITVIGISIVCFCVCSGSLIGTSSNDSERTETYLIGSNDSERTETYLIGSNDSERTATYVSPDSGSNGGNEGTVTTSTTPATSITQSDRTESPRIQEAEASPESTIQADISNSAKAKDPGTSRELLGIPVIWIAGLVGAIIIANVSVVLIMLWRQRQT